MIRVEAASRLHFGLLSFPPEDAGPACWPNLAGEAIVPARRFGGVGLMVEAPGVTVTARPSAEWRAECALAERALAFARQFARSLAPEAFPPLHLAVERSAPEHCGLGTGTQLGLAVARALAAAWGLGDPGATELARRVGRGRRSALGVHGFAHGGLLVEAGQGRGGGISPLVARTDFPEPWRLLLVLPPWEKGLHGDREARAFEQLRLEGLPAAQTDALCRLVLFGLLPALHEGDLPAFGEALYDLNLRAGAAFAAFQGGPYASPRVAELTAFLRQQGVRGVGQSSWGPAVFAVAEDEDRAHDLARRVRQRFGLAGEEVFPTRAQNQGAAVVTVAEGPA
jgi:beta-RFAP synthase